MIEKIGNVKCSRCDRKWIAACESIETKAVECPDCGFMQPVNCAPESAPLEIAETNATSTNRPIMPLEATGAFFDMVCPHCSRALHIDFHIKQR